ncbi:ABC transporter permease [Fulvivirgaceae bacterium PWU4]|uniref:ABC transporter permease n=1 Tax=Chryseosolibacter histidini TaxID=2782349 RepID=A0AAP2DLZ9_9BACT|nr:ABC transporter permease [Chryseosolibacter histidini]MBT1697362.1 ABC transporter permease [Chryseosolibacter histidini]
MIRNYFVIATRNLKNSTLYSIINVVGLSIGIACCLILSLLVLDQLSFDRDNVHAKDIFRVVHRQVDGNQTMNVAYTQGVLGPELIRNFAEIKEATRVGILQENVLIENKEPMERKIIAVDPAFFSIFTIPFKTASSKKNVLPDDGILISESEAVTLFGKDDPIGKVITVQDMASFRVVGVYKDMLRSHLRSGYIISFTWVEKTQPHASSWNFNSFYNYVLLAQRDDAKVIGKRIDTFVHKHTPESWKSFEFFLQPLTEIYVDTTYTGNPMPAIGKTYAYAFAAVGLVILLLACFNYMNMATARSARRALEVGIRKVMGAYRRQLIAQFLMESFIICTFSFLLAILWADLALPFFQSFTNASQIEMMRFDLSNFFSDYRLVAGLILCNFLLALVAGCYPAFFLSRFIPVSVLKGRKMSDSSRKMRRTLVSVQFTLTAILVVLVTVIFRQVHYMKSKDLGFNKEGLLLFAAVPNSNTSVASFKAELQKIAGVKQITVASTLPGRLINTTGLRRVNTPEAENLKIGFVSVDHDYIPTLRLTLLAGRNFHVNGADTDTGIILNEKAVQALGWTPEEAIGKKVSGFIFRDSLPGEVIGVIKDYHVSSLRKEIMPLALSYQAVNNRYIARLESGNLAQTRDLVKQAATPLVSGTTFEAKLMDDYLDSVYMLEEKMGQLFTFFATLAIIIGCLGLYALSAYEGEQRIKELGIRKIMGATSLQLLILLSRNFLRPVFISLVIAMPLAYVIGNFWLQTFPYHTSWSAGIFLQAAFWLLMLGWLTILGQGVRASGLNPADTLRHE